VDKLVVGGLYDIYASGRVNNYFPNINPLDIEIKVDGDRISRHNIDGYHQQMNLRNAMFTGEFSYKGKINVKYNTFALRQMPYGFMTDVVVKAETDCDLLVLNQHRAPESLRETHAYITTVDNLCNPLYTGEYSHYVLMTTTAKSPTGRYDIAATTSFVFPYEEDGAKKYVNVGRITAVVALFVAIVVSPLLSSMDQMFQYIQEYTGLVSPGILAVFIMGLFWKKATNKGAVWGILLSIPIALAFKILPFEMPFMDQMFYTFLFTMVIIMMVSLTSCPTEEDEKGIPLTADLFKTDKVFNICAYIICVLLAVIYTIFF